MKGLPNQTTISLPRVKLECVRCRHTWQQAIPRWDRGHVLMRRGDTTVFVSDEVGYGLGERVDCAPMLEAIGFSAFGPSPCPQCGHDDARMVRGLLTSPSYGNETLTCIELQAHDFMKVGTQWRLRPKVTAALQSTDRPH
jgi:hypothetical protein